VKRLLWSALCLTRSTRTQAVILLGDLCLFCVPNDDLQRLVIIYSTSCVGERLFDFTFNLPFPQSALQVLFGSRVRPAVIAGLGVITLQQITGQPSVLYYASTIFEEAGVYVSATIAVAVFKLICTMVSAYYVDRCVQQLGSIKGRCHYFASFHFLVLSLSFFLNYETWAHVVTTSELKTEAFRMNYSFLLHSFFSSCTPLYHLFSLISNFAPLFPISLSLVLVAAVSCTPASSSRARPSL